MIYILKKIMQLRDRILLLFYRNGILMHFFKVSCWNFTLKNLWHFLLTSVDQVSTQNKFISRMQTLTENQNHRVPACQIFKIFGCVVVVLIALQFLSGVIDQKFIETIFIINNVRTRFVTFPSFAVIFIFY